MSERLPYQDASLPVEERVDDLLARMTLEEKVGQMTQVDGRNDAETWVHQKHAGSFLHTIGPKTEELQTMAEKTRLGIPLIFGIDAIHGHAFWAGAAVFPTQLALSCSWNTDLAREMGRITAKDVRATGVHWTFSPVLCMTRDLRWGRVNETFGEDPYLIGELACAMIEGYQGDDLSDPERVLACAKHYAGYADTQGGRDSAEADIPRRKMLSLYLPPFEKAARAGCATFMTGYQAIDGVPCTANRWLLTDLLKDEWGLDGFVVTDWYNVGHMVNTQMVCATMEEASEKAILAGNDMSMSTLEFPEAAKKAVEAGRVPMELIDDACRRILTMKFRLGLFDEQRHTDLTTRKARIGLPEDVACTFECAVQSTVLLKNDGVLPLKTDVGRIAVLGPNADDIVAQLGDWSFGSGQAEFNASEHKRESISSVLDGIRARAGDNATVTHAQGCNILDDDCSALEEAVALAKDADVAVVVVGDRLEQVGEAKDRANLDLSGGQQALLEAVHATGTPMVVVLINSKPLCIPWVKEHAAAVLEAFNPGMRGGDAVAALLWGDRNPQAKLTISFPCHVGQQPVWYNQMPGWHWGEAHYVDMPREPLWPFGFGLSYTTFSYGELNVLTPEMKKDEALRVSVEITNTGERPGVEIAQLYVNDLVSSVTTSVKELKAYQRVELAPGETKSVVFEVPYMALSLVNAQLERVVEPGEFVVMVGASSADADLQKAAFTVC